MELHVEYFKRTAEEGMLDCWALGPRLYMPHILSWSRTYLQPPIRGVPSSNQGAHLLYTGCLATEPLCIQMSLFGNGVATNNPAARDVQPPPHRRAAPCI